jgi:hypothetical protein
MDQLQGIFPQGRISLFQLKTTLFNPISHVNLSNSKSSSALCLHGLATRHFSQGLISLFRLQDGLKNLYIEENVRTIYNLKRCINSVV